MKVLLLPSFFPTARQPHLVTFVRDYALSVALEHDVTVLYAQQLGTPGVGGQPFFEQEWLAPRLRLVSFTYVHVRRTWILSNITSVLRMWWRTIRSWGVDIIFAHVALPAGPSALALGRLLRVPVILVEHWGPARAWMGWPPYYHIPFSRLQYATVAYTYRHVDRLVGVSRSQAEDITAVFHTKVHGLLNNPIDCRIFAPEAKSATMDLKRVLCVSRVDSDPRKGIPNLLAAWQEVARLASKPVLLEIVGRGAEGLQAEIEARGIAKSCVLSPWRAPAVLAEKMKTSDLVVIPSSYETFGRSGAEAMACGVPVVATRCGGPEDYIGSDTGLLVPTDDPAALGQAIVRALDRDRFAPPGILATRARQQFSYEAICERFTELALELVSRRRSS